MAENHTLPRSFLGPYWSAFRKWFYTAWLTCETSYRFYEYAVDVSLYFGQQNLEVIGWIAGAVTFIICTLFLTVPCCVLLYKFFTSTNLTNTRFEAKFKYYF